MKKQLIKEITDINKLIKNEQKNKSELDLKLDSLEQEINSIEDKFKSQTKDINIYESYPKISKLEKLYENYFEAIQAMDLKNYTKHPCVKTEKKYLYNIT